MQKHKTSETIEVNDNTIWTTSAVVRHTEVESEKYLLIQEKDESWGFVGGAKDIEDANLMEALEREILEEIGLVVGEYTVEETDVLYEFTYSHESSPRFGKVGKEQFFIVDVKDISELKLADDILDAQWFTKEKAIEMLSSVEFFNYRADYFKKVLGE